MKKHVSIVIPAFNGGDRFRLVLDMIFRQKYKDFELIVIDSGSADGSVELVKKYPAKLIQIKSSEFGHGKTRNFGATLAKGDIIVFLTQDALPSSDRWLASLIAPFSDKKIAGVYGRQIPKPDENVLDKNFFLSLYGEKDFVWTAQNCTQGDNIFSDANSAVRKELILMYPYKTDIIVSEDYEWAIKMLAKGYNIYYSIHASVIHSHAYNLATLFKRNFDVGVSYKDIYTSGQNVPFLKKGLKIYRKEIKHLIHTGYAHLTPLATIRDITRFVAISIGKKEHLISKRIKKTYLSAQRWYWV
jgi:rhamnosyltransferase